jgi:hypothetical protein
MRVAEQALRLVDEADIPLIGQRGGVIARPEIGDLERRLLRHGDDPC